MPAFASEFEAALLVAVERSSQRDEVLNAAGAFLDQNSNGLDIAEAVARGQSVGQM